MPTHRKAGKTLAVNDILSAIKSLSISDRKNLFAQLESSWETVISTGYVLWPATIQDVILKIIDATVCKEIPRLAKVAKELSNQLQKHRKPKSNSERDEEIVRLHDLNKSAGEIVMDIADRWKLTDSAVRSVIWRSRKK